MARNKNKFKSDIKALSDHAMEKAMTASFSTSLSENASVEEMTTKIAKECAKAFAEELQKLGPIIDDYIDSMTLDLTKVSAPNGPLTGIGKIMKT